MVDVPFLLLCTEAKGNHPFLLCNFILCFENIQFYFAVFQKYSNSNSNFYPSMEYLTIKILFPHPNRKHVASLHYKKISRSACAPLFTSMSNGK